MTKEGEAYQRWLEELRGLAGTEDCSCQQYLYRQYWLHRNTGGVVEKKEKPTKNKKEHGIRK